MQKSEKQRHQQKLNEIELIPQIKRQSKMTKETIKHSNSKTLKENSIRDSFTQFKTKRNEKQKNTLKKKPKNNLHNKTYKQKSKIKTTKKKKQFKIAKQALR